MSELKPAIVIAAYNRDQSLARLLKMLARAHYPLSDVQLVISIDGGGAEAVKELAGSFEWKHGEKSVICHEQNLGLREHILRCGDLTEQYGAVIVLEDDLGVSSYFYDYALKALEVFGNSDEIAGISLYKHLINVNCGMRFDPLDNGLGYYFMQFAQSWGQMWSRAQWSSFRQWYDVEENRRLPVDIPSYVNGWPESSWLKYFIRYIVDQDKYFVYPMKSLTTNFSDVGTHMAQLNNNTYQVPLSEHAVSLVKNDKNVICYDVYFEMVESSLRAFICSLPSQSLVLDLYGIRDLEQYSDDQHVLTIRESRNSIESWGFRLKPREMNIIQGLEGATISLCMKSEVLIERQEVRLAREFVYDKKWLGIRAMFKLFLASRLAGLLKRK